LNDNDNEDFGHDCHVLTAGLGGGAELAAHIGKVMPVRWTDFDVNVVSSETKYWERQRRSVPRYGNHCYHMEQNSNNRIRDNDSSGIIARNQRNHSVSNFRAL
jgi:hypothetical protein